MARYIFSIQDKECQECKAKSVSLRVFIPVVCALLIVCTLATYALASSIFQQKLVDLQQSMLGMFGDTDLDEQGTPSLSTSFPELELIQLLFEQYSIQDIDKEQLLNTVLKAYVRGTGDEYAQYYTKEELEQLTADNQGQMVGIGISVVDDEIEISGMPIRVLTVVSVFRDSPALAAGVRIGDHIFSVTDEAGATFTVEELGYDQAISCVRGMSGTQAEFTVFRFSVNESQYEQISFSATRAQLTTESVTGRVVEGYPNIGLVSITQFDLTTPTQFKQTMDELILEGCDRFIFDIRYNPGGDLASVEAVLSTLLKRGDEMIHCVYKDGSRETDIVRPVVYDQEGYEGCTVTLLDIGKYRGYSFVVLINQDSASAAELFAANLRDHEIATLVGTTTFGKGIMQSTFDLSYFGIDGAVKLTTAWYQPPSGENYHGVGISPHSGMEVEMEASVLEKYGNIYLIPDAEDAQLQAAIEVLK